MSRGFLFAVVKDVSRLLVFAMANLSPMRSSAARAALDLRAHAKT
jgi:hypothetical protein